MENNENKKVSTPQAIIIAGVLIMLAILVTGKKSANFAINTAPKTLSEQVGVVKDNLTACIQSMDVDTLHEDILKSVNDAMVNVPQNERGTPYSVIIGKDGPVTDIRGYRDFAALKEIIDNATLGNVTDKYTGNIPVPNANDHIMGNLNAPIVIVEYSDFECPYCKMFHPVLEQAVKEYKGNVAWVYRHWPLHQHSFEKLAAAECVAQLKGNNAFWKYADLLFGSLKTSQDSISDQL